MHDRSRKLSLLLSAAASRAAQAAGTTGVALLDPGAAAASSAPHHEHQAHHQQHPQQASQQSQSSHSQPEIGPAELVELLHRHAGSENPATHGTHSIAPAAPAPTSTAVAAAPAIDPVLHAQLQNQLARELLVELLGFAPTDVVDDVINSVNALLYQTIEALEDFVEDRLAAHGADDDEVERGMVAVETLLENAVDSSFDRFEVFVLSNIFKIPDAVRVTLPHYDGVEPLGIGPDEAERLDADLDAKIQDAARRLAAAQYFQQQAETKIREIDAQLPILLRTADVFDQVVNRVSEPSDPPLPSTLTFISDELAHLRGSASRAAALSAALPSPSAVAAAHAARPRALARSVSSYLDRRRAARLKKPRTLSPDSMRVDDDADHALPAGAGLEDRAAPAGEDDIRRMEAVGAVPEFLKALCVSRPVVDAA
ncbi:hypothetical protein HK405_013541 [Cladochytrium tenue]|nr:hypothetical protein HK405_013541 [Cladochytrium tenue]